MLDQNTFMETIRKVTEIMKTSEETLSREQILSYFDSMDLNENQKNMIFEYLMKPQDEATEEEKAEASVQSREEDEKFPESQVLRMYMEELQGLNVYEGEELEDLYEDLLDGDRGCIEKIADSWMGRILKMAKKLDIDEADFSDLIQEGNVGLIMKIEEICGCGHRMDVDKVLCEAVETSMKAYVQELSGEDDVENAMVGKATLVNEARKYLMEANGQEPSVQELSAYTRMSTGELRDILDMIQKAEDKMKR